MSALGNLYNNDRDESTEESDHYNDPPPPEQEEGSYENDNNQYDEDDNYQQQNDEYHEEEEPDSDDSRVHNDGYGEDSSNNENYDEQQQHDGDGDYNEYSQNQDDDEYRGDDDAYYDQDNDGYHDEEDYHGDEDLEKPRDFQGDSGGNLSRRQKMVLGLGCCICFLLALVLGTGIGAIMANNDTSFCEWFGWCDGDDDKSSGGGGDCPPPPVFEPESTFTCPEDNVQLEFRLTFDGSPADVGFRVADLFNVSLWNFPPRTFGTIALMNRENVFSVCLSPQANYTFVLTDTEEDGLISNRFGSTQFGAFTLFYAGEVVTTYHGDCDSSTNPAECGSFTECTYSLAANTTSGSCLTTGPPGNNTGI